MFFKPTSVNLHDFVEVLPVRVFPRTIFTRHAFTFSRMLRQNSYLLQAMRTTDMRNRMLQWARASGSKDRDGGGKFKTAKTMGRINKKYVNSSFYIT